MKIIFCLLMAAACFAADRPAAKKKSAPAAAAKTEIPAGAKETSPGTWEYTDAQGKHWTYRKTPFGIAKFQERSAEEKALEQRKLADQITATEDGDSVKFERPGPFGPYRWAKKKTELNDVEKEVWNRCTTAAREKAKQE